MIKTIKRNCRLVLFAVLACCVIMSYAGMPYVYAGTPTVRENVDLSAAKGNIIVGIEGKDVTSDEATLLSKINAARYEACNNGITPDPRDNNRMLTPEDYVPIQIGKNCNNAVKIRATEAALYMAHVRPIGTDCLGIIKTYLGSSYKGSGENLAWDSGDKSNIDLWLDEKDAYLGLSGGQTGHYATIINPKFKYTGMATFNPTNDTAPYDWSCTAGQYSVVDEPVDSFAAAKNEVVIQKIEVPVKSVTNAEISGDTMINKGETSDLSLLVSLGFSSGIANNTVSKCPVYDGALWVSSAPEVLTVNEAGHIEAKSTGTATVSATIGDGENAITVSKEYIVVDGSVTVTSVVDPDMITVESTKKPVLPSVVTANLSNGETCDLAVVWDSYDADNLFTYFKSKEFDISGKAGTFDVTQKIHVNAAKMTGTYTNPKVITTDSGVEPEYPKAYVGMSNGMAYKDLNVIWDEESKNYYKVKEGGTFTMKGVTSYAFQTDDGPKQFEVTLTLIVNPEEGYGKTPDPEETPGPTNPSDSGSGETKTPNAAGDKTPGSGGSEVPGTDGGKQSGGNTSATDNGTQNTDVGSVVESGGAEYKITEKSDSGNSDSVGTVTYVSTNKDAVNVTVPDKVEIGGKNYRVTYIEDNAFKGNKKLKKVVIGNYITKIGKNAFKGCKNLKTLKLGNNLKVIDNSAFEGCTALTSVTVTKNVTKIGKKAFYKCKGLKNIKLNSNHLESVGSKAFKKINKKYKLKVKKKFEKKYKKLMKGKIGA